MVIDINRFDRIWRIVLLITLILGFAWTVMEFKEISRDGVACKSQPFIWGARNLVETVTNNGQMECTCTIYDDKGYFKYYSFNEEMENPSYLSRQNINTLEDFEFDKEVLENGTAR